MFCIIPLPLRVPLLDSQTLCGGKVLFSLLTISPMLTKSINVKIEIMAEYLKTLMTHLHSSYKLSPYAQVKNNSD